MVLNRKIIAREEDYGVLLYNGDNGGLIQVDREAFERFFSMGITDGEGYEALHDCLFRNGFLEDSPALPEPDTPTSDRAAALRGFFDLRSRRSPLNVLWAVTPICNLRCIYCFPDARSNMGRCRPRPLDAMLAVADQVAGAKVLKVILSGGECLLFEGVWDIAERLRGFGLTVTMLSNGAAITERVAERALALSLTFGVSLDGPDDRVNAATRGVGAFEGAVRGISLLIGADVPVAVLVTVTCHNFDHIERLFALLAALGVDSVTLQDLRPFGTREVYDRTRLTADQEKGLRPLFARLRKVYPLMNIETSELFIFSERKTNDLVMQCPAGDHFAYIDFHGDVYPCTSLPSFKLGNVLRGGSLVDLWQRSRSIRALRRLKGLRLSQLTACGECASEPCCEGGCRGDALFYRGDLLGRPSRCPKEMGLR
jgi:radical SAM protein with 4Fe4S-binding SPASM domain